MKTIIADAVVGELDRLRDFVDCELEAFGCKPGVMLSMDLVVEEVFVNIASYAYPDGNGKAEVSVGCDGVPGTVTLIFRDSGIPFDPVARPDADTSPEALNSRVGGLGILLVKKTMDEVVYAREGGCNVLTLKKKL